MKYSEYVKEWNELENNPKHSNPKLQSLLNSLRYSSPNRWQSFSIPKKVEELYIVIKELLDIATKYPLNDRDLIKPCYSDGDGRWHCASCDCYIFDESDSEEYTFPYFCPMCGQRIKRGLYDRF